jgi:regulator of RNase E activity RraA
VTNGAVRDIPAVENLGFHFFAGSLSVSHSYVHIVEVGQPVQIDGLTIRPSDLLHGDLHGIQTIPDEIVGDLPGVAAKLAARERALIALAQTPRLPLDQLRAAVGGGRSS